MNKHRLFEGLEKHVHDNGIALIALQLHIANVHICSWQHHVNASRFFLANAK